ncbi:MAG: aminotransferase class I/II-fold pyridoxal phosphate-dependent enzyme [Anaerolineae bacterium]|nr:MAG: aminotransferase class I/II-fold pyridoxal phosphate-dependent enzyme [Anaerolineae bacterium]
MTAFQPFEMERLMSKWENVVEFNLSESGVHPLTLRELVADPVAVEALLSTELNYPQANGTVELRENIAALYPGATPDNVLVTVGCAEANFITLQTLLSAGDEMVMMLPNYMQIWGLGHNYGLQVKAFHLHEERGWALDLGELSDAVTDKTKLIAACNPNNPTGCILTEAEMDAIVAAAERVGAWLLADEVYSGAERLSDVQAPSFWGRYDKVLAMNSLSKAYGLPGLRTGWVVGPADTVDDIWARHEYTTISTTMLSNKLATIALSPQVRPRLLQRTRDYIRRGFPILDGWLESHEGTFTLIPPQAAAIAFARYHLDVNSTRLVNRLMREKSVLIVPGDHFGLDHHLRISYGLSPDYLRAGLDRIHELIVELQGQNVP